MGRKPYLRSGQKIDLSRRNRGSSLFSDASNEELPPPKGGFTSCFISNKFC